MNFVFFRLFCQTVTLLSKTAGGEIWVSMVEKAFAKSFGGYDRIDAYLASGPMDPFHDLTGCPTEYIDLRKLESDEQKNELWSKLLHWVDESSGTQQVLMTASCGKLTKKHKQLTHFISYVACRSIFSQKITQNAKQKFA